MLLFMGTTYLALSHTRGILFLLLVGMLPVLDNFNGFNKISNVSIKPNKYVYLIYLILLLAMGSFCAFNIKFVKEEQYRLYAFANYLDNFADKDIKLYTDYNNGGYMEYKGYKCYIDSRAEVFYKSNNKKQDVMVEYVNLFSNVNPKDFLNKYDFDYLLVANYDGLYYYLENLHYSIVYEINYYEGDFRGYRLYKNNEVQNEESD